MEADPDSTSDNCTHQQEPEHTPDICETGNAPDTEEIGVAPFDRMVWPRPKPDDLPEDLPNTIPDNAEWCYDQKARGKRGKDRRYTGHIQRISGSAGEKIRSDFAAVIRDLLEWAKDHDAGAEKESREDGGADDQSQ